MHISAPQQTFAAAATQKATGSRRCHVCTAQCAYNRAPRQCSLGNGQTLFDRRRQGRKGIVGNGKGFGARQVTMATHAGRAKAPSPIERVDFALTFNAAWRVAASVRSRAHISRPTTSCRYWLQFHPPLTPSGSWMNGLSWKACAYAPQPQLH